MRIIGPNTTGTVSVPDRFSTTFFSIDVIRGGAAYVAQTGIFASSTFRWISTR